VGYGHLRTYVDGKVDWFDHIDIRYKHLVYIVACRLRSNVRI
jgi:hypothetical protein